MSLGDLLGMYRDSSSHPLVSAALGAKVLALALEWSKQEDRLVNTRCVQPGCVEFVHAGMRRFVVVPV